VQAKEIASAALRAIRDPSDALVDRFSVYFSDPCFPEDMKRGFTAIIDAISRGEDQ